MVPVEDTLLVSEDGGKNTCKADLKGTTCRKWEMPEELCNQLNEKVKSDHLALESEWTEKFKVSYMITYLICWWN